MAFDVDAFRAAHRPWSFTVGGRTFLARHVSAPQCQRFERERAAAGADQRKHRTAFWRILRAAFPWRPSYLTRGDPVRIILDELEPPARAETLTDFFECLRGESAIGPQTILGTRSPAPTAPPRR
jgi:hypothetical protein